MLSSEVSPLIRGGHILKSLALKTQVLENCPVLGLRTVLFFEPLKLCRKTPKNFRKICEYLCLGGSPKKL